MNEKLQHVNRFIATARALRERVSTVAATANTDRATDEVFRQLAAHRLELVRVAHAVAAAPPDPDADRIVGAVLLQRISSAVGVRAAEEWEAAASAALAAAGPDANTHRKTWLEISEPIIDLGDEAIDRVEQQGYDLMVEGLRRAAEQTPGITLRISETIGDTVISDQTIFGPEPGHEDPEECSVGRVSAPMGSALGIDDERMPTDVNHLLRPQAQLILARNNLPSTAAEDQVRATVCHRVLSTIKHDLDIVGVTGDLPTTVTGLGTQHFPALRTQLLLQHVSPLSEGALLSRAQRGDHGAQSILGQFTILADLLSRADPYYLPLDQLDTPLPSEDTRPLPPERSFLVWHDTAVQIGAGVDVLAWMFITDQEGGLHPVAHIIGLHDGGLETSWCSLRNGQAAPTATQISRLLHSTAWETARPVWLPKPPGTKAWKQALPRSAARLKAGGLHGLRTLPRKR